jgi:hypothetical protein
MTRTPILRELIKVEDPSICAGYELAIVDPINDKNDNILARTVVTSSNGQYNLNLITPKWNGNTRVLSNVSLGVERTIEEADSLAYEALKSRAPKFFKVHQFYNFTDLTQNNQPVARNK